MYYDTKRSGLLEIIEYVSSKEVKVRFLDTGYETITRMSSVRSGNVKDPFAKSVYGVGYIGDVGAMLGISNIYDRWRGMIARCYWEKHPSYHLYGGAGIRVVDEWHNFCNYRDWFLTEISKLDSSAVKLDVDKDLKGFGIYSPDACTLLPNYLNICIRVHHKNSRKYPGVLYLKDKRKYVARVSRRALSKEFGIRSSGIGYYTKDSDAFRAYMEEKQDIVHNLADIALVRGHVSNETYQALKTWSVPKALGPDWEMTEIMLVLDSFSDTTFSNLEDMIA